MIHPSVQPGFHPNSGFWVFLAVLVICVLWSALRRAS